MDDNKMTITTFYQLIKQMLMIESVQRSYRHKRPHVVVKMKETACRVAAKKLAPENNNNNNNNVRDKEVETYSAGTGKEGNVKTPTGGNHCLVYALPALAAILCYVNSLRGDLVHDDVMAIRNNQDVRPNTPLRNLAVNDFWGKAMWDNTSHKSYRPLTVLSFRLNYMYGGLDTFGFHVVNVFLHAAATVLFVRLARWLWPKQHLAGMAGVMFAVHPVHTEAVAGIVGRADVLACVFFLLALLTYINRCPFSRNPSPNLAANRHPSLAISSLRNDWSPFIRLKVAEKRNSGCLQTASLLVLTAMLSAAALLAKEHAVTVLGVCLLLDLCCISRPWQQRRLTDAWKMRCALRWLTLLLTICLLLGIRLTLLHGRLPAFSNQDNPAAFARSRLTRWLTHLHVYSLNVWLMAVPLTLSYDWQMGSVPLVQSLLDLRNLASLGLLVLLLWLCVVGASLLRKQSSRVHQKPVITGAVLLVLPFLPASNLFFTVGFVLAERVLYIPSMGFIILVVHGFSCLMTSLPKQRGQLLAIFYAICLLLAGRTMVRNRVWQSRELLFRSGVQTFPHNAKMHYNYANWLKDVGSFADAVEHYRTAIRLWPTYASAHNNVGTILSNNTEAISHYRHALEIQPGHAKAWFNLGHALSKEGLVEEGLQALEQSYKNDPNNADTCVSLGMYHEKMGNTQHAELFYQKAVDLDSDDLTPYSKLAEALLAQGELDPAVSMAKKALSKKPDHLLSLKVATTVLAKQGKAWQASKLYTRALSVRYDSAVLDATGIFFFNWGKEQEALQLFQSALAMKPHDARVLLHYSQVLSATGQLEEAEKNIHRALKLQPHRADCLRQLAAIYGELKLHQKAINVLELAARHTLDQATHAGIFFDIGKNFRDLKQFVNASRCFQKAVQLQPDLAEAHHYLGVIYHMQGDFTKAGEHYAAAKKLTPNDPLLLNNLHKLQKVTRENKQQELSHTGTPKLAKKSFSDAISAKQQTQKPTSEQNDTAQGDFETRALNKELSEKQKEPSMVKQHSVIKQNVPLTPYQQESLDIYSLLSSTGENITTQSEALQQQQQCCQRLHYWQCAPKRCLTLLSHSIVPSPGENCLPFHRKSLT